jgi:8-oxo-dGTP diphosphatase
VPLTRVIAAVIERGDCVLVAQRPSAKRHGGMWEFPGGKVEGSESDLDAIRRELAEELGVRVVSISTPIAAIQDPGSDHVIVFVPTLVHGEPECWEHAAIRWASWSDLDALPLAPTDRRFVAGKDRVKP